MTDLDRFVAAAILVGVALIWLRDAIDDELSWLVWIGNGLAIAGVLRLAYLLATTA